MIRSYKTATLFFYRLLDLDYICTLNNFALLIVDYMLGNRNLCGLPLQSCSGSTTNIFLYTTSLHEKYSQLLKKILIFLITLLIVAVLVASLIVARSRRKSVEVVLGRTSVPKDQKPSSNALATGIDNDNTDENQNHRKSGGGELGKLTFLRDERRRFELHDLLRASAEILGSGTFGASYKATVESDSLVVKRYKEMNGVGREEFHEHMRRLGGLTHPNLLPLVAYYYRREEKLLVYDYVRNGSLAFHLHGKPFIYILRLRLLCYFCSVFKFIITEKNKYISKSPLTLTDQCYK